MTPWDTTLAVHASKNDVEHHRRNLRRAGNHEPRREFGVALRQPLYKTLARHRHGLPCRGSGAERDVPARTAILACHPAPSTAKSDVFATRLTLDWVNRSQVHVLALRSDFQPWPLRFWLDARRSGASSTVTGAAVPRAWTPKSPTASSSPGSARRSTSAAFSTLRPCARSRTTYGWNLLRETTLVLRAERATLRSSRCSRSSNSASAACKACAAIVKTNSSATTGSLPRLEARVPIWLAKDKTPIVSIAPFFDCRRRMELRQDPTRAIRRSTAREWACWSMPPGTPRSRSIGAILSWISTSKRPACRTTGCTLRSRSTPFRETSHLSIALFRPYFANPCCFSQKAQSFVQGCIFSGSTSLLPRPMPCFPF